MEMVLNNYYFCKKEGIMAELIRDEQSKDLRIALFQRGKIAYVNKFVNSSGGVYIPPQNGYCFPEVILLPSIAEDYGDNSLLYDEIDRFIDKYIEIDEAFRTICVHYILLTYHSQKFHAVPYLRVIGGFGCGKSTLTSTLGLLSYRGFEVSGSVTAPVLFRTLDEFRVCLVIDESNFADESDGSELMKILNNGYTKNKPVPRLERIKGGFTTKTYSVFGPKILNGRHRFENEALESRCITHKMRESNQRPISYQLPVDYFIEAQILRNKLLKYRFESYYKISTEGVFDSKTFVGIGSPRLRQLMIPFLAVGVSEKKKSEIKDYFLEKEENIRFIKTHSLEGCVLRAVKNKIGTGYVSGRGPIIIEICEEARELYGYKHWTLTPKKVGSILRDFGLRTKRSTGGNYVLIPEETRLVQAYLDYGIEVSDE